MLVPRPVLPLIIGALAAALAVLVAAFSLMNTQIYTGHVAARMMPGTVSQDLFSVIVGAVLLGLCGVLRRRDGVLWLFWMGCVGYLAYAYAIYAFEAVITPLFLLYVAILGLSIWSAIAFLARVDLGALRAGRPPRRLTAALFGMLVVMFLFLWMTILIPAIHEGTRAEGNTIFILDLSFVLPLLAVAAVMLVASAPMGDLLAIPLLIKAGSLGLSVLLGTLLSPLYGLPAPLSEIVTYTILGCLPLLLIPGWLRHLRVG